MELGPHVSRNCHLTGHTGHSRGHGTVHGDSAVTVHCRFSPSMHATASSRSSTKARREGRLHSTSSLSRLCVRFAPRCSAPHRSPLRPPSPVTDEPPPSCLTGPKEAPHHHAPPAPRTCVIFLHEHPTVIFLREYPTCGSLLQLFLTPPRVLRHQGAPPRPLLRPPPR
jgi:hypothetical protein